MSTERIHDLIYYLIAYDKDGRERCVDPDGRSAFTPLIVGFHWPHKPHGEEELSGTRTLNAEAGMGSSGPAGHPGEDREPFDPQRAYKNARLAAAQGAGGAGAAAFGGGGSSAILSPLRQLSFWTLKNRGRDIGESAGFSLLKQIQSAVPDGRDVRFHLTGHSFGCIVVSSMLRAPDGATLPRPVTR